MSKNLKNKITAALYSCFESGAILESDDEFLFAIGGEQEFLKDLLPRLDAAERAEFLADYVLTWADAQVADLCEGMTSKSVHPLITAANSAAFAILENSQDFIAQINNRLEVQAMQDAGYQAMVDDCLLEALNA